jgi:hypothetical protein
MHLTSQTPIDITLQDFGIKSANEGFAISEDVSFSLSTFYGMIIVVPFKVVQANLCTSDYNFRYNIAFKYDATDNALLSLYIKGSGTVGRFYCRTLSYSYVTSGSDTSSYEHLYIDTWYYFVAVYDKTDSSHVSLMTTIYGNAWLSAPTVTYCDTALMNQSQQIANNMNILLGKYYTKTDNGDRLVFRTAKLKYSSSFQIPKTIGEAPLGPDDDVWVSFDYLLLDDEDKFIAVEDFPTGSNVHMLVPDYTNAITHGGHTTPTVTTDKFSDYAEAGLIALANNLDNTCTINIPNTGNWVVDALAWVLEQMVEVITDAFISGLMVLIKTFGPLGDLVLTSGQNLFEDSIGGLAGWIRGMVNLEVSSYYDIGVKMGDLIGAVVTDMGFDGDTSEPILAVDLSSAASWLALTASQFRIPKGISIDLFSTNFSFSTLFEALFAFIPAPLLNTIFPTSEHWPGRTSVSGNDPTITGHTGQGVRWVDVGVAFISYGIILPQVIQLLAHLGPNVLKAGFNLIFNRVKPRATNEDVIECLGIAVNNDFEPTGDTLVDKLTTITNYTNEVESLLKNATYGLSALENLVDTLETSIATMDGNTDEIELLLKDGVYGLEQIKDLVNTTITDISTNHSLLVHETYGLSIIKSELSSLISDFSSETNVLTSNSLKYRLQSIQSEMDSEVSDSIKSDLSKLKAELYASDKTYTLREQMAFIRNYIQAIHEYLLDPMGNERPSKMLSTFWVET